MTKDLSKRKEKKSES